MPAVRSLFTLSVLATCLAQVLADGHMGGDMGDDKGGEGGFGSFGGGSDKDMTEGSWEGGNSYDQYMTQTMYEASVMTVEMPTTIFKAEDCPPAATSTITETSTVTAASACSSAVTAYVTQWMNAPPGCWCGGGEAPMSGWEMGWGGPSPLGDAPVFTSFNAAFTQGLSSIPASEAVQTGVTVAGAAAAPSPTAAVSVGGFSTEESSSMTTSGTESSGSSSVPSNMAESTKAGEAPEPEASTTTTTSSSSASISTTLSETTTMISTTSISLASAEAASTTGDGSFPVGSFQTLDPATLTLKNAYTLGIGKRAPQPTLLSP
ncbi:uncharacterized protein Z518_08642 [Rhinocladiella mackenziei CBS 650.93]|uniref:Uncharacterized protein n=1 Tax=Rhinocladiella mackenziei CBS 650.93 TaxID=1442369 RepID=A0A0D2J1C9_9EURO|nr:uncharacterized protein Z518_08642 [Rhinocladiella mackenziei CBS 650.93]KIX02700.1 hypothetical protein Z518_08642 [Rhinocladiella mackenziei CBS 650.93]